MLIVASQAGLEINSSLIEGGVVGSILIVGDSGVLSQIDTLDIYLANYVTIDTPQTITGLKDFTVSPTVPTAAPGTSTTQAASTEFVTSGAAISDALVVHKAGAEDITGTKRFTVRINADGGMALPASVGINTPGWLVYQNATSFVIRDTTNSKQSFLMLPGPTGYAEFSGDLYVTNNVTVAGPQLIFSGAVSTIILNDVQNCYLQAFSNQVTLKAASHIRYASGDSHIFSNADQTVQYMRAEPGGVSTGFPITFRNATSTQPERQQGFIAASWVDNTDATRKGRLSLKVSDFTGTDKEGIAVQSDGTNVFVGLGQITAQNESIPSRVTIFGSNDPNIDMAFWRRVATTSQKIGAVQYRTGAGGGFLVAEIEAQTGSAFIDSGDLVFKTRSSGGVSTEKMRIGSNGTVTFNGALVPNGGIVMPDGGSIIGAGAANLLIGDANDTVNIVGGVLQVTSTKVTTTVDMGVGTNLPARRLHVKGTGSQYIQLEGSGGLVDVAMEYNDGVTKIYEGILGNSVALGTWGVYLSSIPGVPLAILSDGKVVFNNSSITFKGSSSTTPNQPQAKITPSWADSTDATRKGRLSLQVSDFTGTDKEGLRLDIDGTRAIARMPGRLIVGNVVDQGVTILATDVTNPQIGLWNTTLNAVALLSLESTAFTFGGVGVQCFYRYPVHRFMNQGATVEFLSLSATGATFGVPPVFPTVPDANIPNGGMAWSSTTPGALKARDPSGVLKTVNLT